MTVHAHVELEQMLLTQKLSFQVISITIVCFVTFVIRPKQLVNTGLCAFLSFFFLPVARCPALSHLYGACSERLVLP